MIAVEREKRENLFLLFNFLILFDNSFDNNNITIKFIIDVIIIITKGHLIEKFVCT